MAKVYVTVVIHAPVTKVWNEIRDFNALPQWHPFISDSRIEDDLDSSAIGCVRNFQLADSGDTIREQLLGLSDHERRVTYSIVEAALPIRNYVASLRLIPVTVGDVTLGEWQAEFDVEPADEAEAAGLVTSVFEEGLKNLNQVLGA